MRKENDTIYYTKELASFFRVSEKTILEWCKRSQLPAFKIGRKWRVRAKDLRHIINAKIRTNKKTKPGGLF